MKIFKNRKSLLIKTEFNTQAATAVLLYHVLDFSLFSRKLNQFELNDVVTVVKSILTFD